jgi:hypothetical protein
MRHDARWPRVSGGPATSRTHDEWFNDDVVVDFPSVRRIVERMRASFFGGVEPDADALCGDLHLTARQARLGGRIPVDVPVRRVCDVCGGRGEVWDEPCVSCGGAGSGLLLRKVEVDVPSGVRHGESIVFSVATPHAATRVHLRVSVA